MEQQSTGSSQVSITIQQQRLLERGKQLQSCLSPRGEHSTVPPLCQLERNHATRTYAEGHDSISYICDWAARTYYIGAYPCIVPMINAAFHSTSQSH